jgi:lambda family phage portal protein
MAEAQLFNFPQKNSTVLTAWTKTSAPSVLKARQAKIHHLPAMQKQGRAFVAGLANRLTSNLTSTNTSIDADLVATLNTLRARSRHLCQNNEFGKKFLSLVETNVVGSSGFGFQSAPFDYVQAGGEWLKVTDKAAKNAIEEAFYVWGDDFHCEITGQYSFVDLQRLIARTLAQDGEVLIRRIRSNINPYGYTQQIIDVDRLMVNDNRQLDNGNMVRMGVELDKFTRPVAYWLRTTHPNDTGMARTNEMLFERVPASEIFHLFISIRPEQRRGIPWIAASIHTLYHLMEFDQSALVAARKGADTLGFFVSPNGEPPIGDQDADGNYIDVSVPGTFDTLPEGYDIKSVDSKYPNEMYDSFTKAILHRLASGCDLAYHSLNSDLSEVNFSSIRSGELEMRDNWMKIQNFIIGKYLKRTFYDCLETSLLKSAIKLPNGSALPAAKIEKWKTHIWQGRRWQWVDPLKDIMAARLAVKTGVASPQMIAAQQGVDIEDVIEQIAQFEKMVSDKKLTSIDFEISDNALALALGEPSTKQQGN